MISSHSPHPNTITVLQKRVGLSEHEKDLKSYLEVVQFSHSQHGQMVKDRASLEAEYDRLFAEWEKIRTPSTRKSELHRQLQEMNVVLESTKGGAYGRWKIYTKSQIVQQRRLFERHQDTVRPMVENASDDLLRKLGFDSPKEIRRLLDIKL